MGSFTMCFHHLGAFEFARGYYGMALAAKNDDVISESLAAECTLRIDGPRAASKALSALLAKPMPTDTRATSYIERARKLQQKLMAIPGIDRAPTAAR